MNRPADSRRNTIALGLGVGVLILVVVGLPIVIVAQPRFAPAATAQPQDAAVLGLMILIAAAFGATFGLPPAAVRWPRLAAIGGSIIAFAGAINLALLAISCPSWTGAIRRLFGERETRIVLQPLQPALVLSSLILLGLTLALRLQPVPNLTRLFPRPVSITHSHTRTPVWTSAMRWRWVRRIVPALALAIAGMTLVLEPASTAVDSRPAADFTLPVAVGLRTTLSLHDLRGHAVLLNFFNSQCPPCIQEMPTLRQTAQAYRTKGVIVLGVATGGDTVTTARAFARAQHVSFPVVTDDRQDVAWRYLVTGWPTSFFLDAQGRLRGRFDGPMDRQTVRAGLAQAKAIRCDRCTPLHSLSVGTIYLGTGAPTTADAQLHADVVFTPPPAAPPFSLRDQRGVPITPTHLRGRVVALTFISAVCRSQCPFVGATLGQIRRDLGPLAGRLSIVAISPDPERDSVRATLQFAAHAGWGNTDWHYLTASRTTLTQVWSAYNELVGPPPKAGQDPQHLAGLYLIDPRGRLRIYDNAPFLAPRVAGTIRALLTH
jgi:cytochrome oxidase Cu insertion factor (SCO1/SenC/PrrC family)